ncbi:hypothetical protein K0M31_011506 [Melipona bicolor]|uniref:Uncharacterized protein n=1 Tax=Melipona bicolor TaxID=60889 RepID=A0AA40G9W0_9HYME|nr:hypothetical protein K0M31_011506 [Melipona bicolor]
METGDFMGTLSSNSLQILTIVSCTKVRLSRGHRVGLEKWHPSDRFPLPLSQLPRAGWLHKSDDQR